MASSATSENLLPLAGLRVVALEQAAAAPFCSRQLADMGADVIKIASPVFDGIYGCHPERSEGSLAGCAEILRFAQNDRGAFLLKPEEPQNRATGRRRLCARV